MEQAVYAENGDRKARSGQIIAWAVTFTILQVVSLVTVIFLMGAKVPFFNQELSTEGTSNLRCIAPDVSTIRFPGPGGKELSIEAHDDSHPAKEGTKDAEGNATPFCSSDADCEGGYTCGNLTPSTTWLKKFEYDKEMQRQGIKTFKRDPDLWPNFIALKCTDTTASWCFEFPLSGTPPPNGAFGWGGKGTFVMALTPVGLVPPPVLFLIALAVGIPLQRRAMRHLNAVQLSDQERSALLAETKRMGADGEDKSRIGRLIASAVGAVAVLAIAYPLFAGVAWFVSGFHEVPDGPPVEVKSADGTKSLGFKQNMKSTWDAKEASYSWDVTSGLKSPQFDGVSGKVTLKWQHDNETPAGPNGWNCEDPRLNPAGKAQCNSFVGSHKMQAWAFVFPAAVSLVGLFPFFPILPLIGARLIGVPLQRKASFNLGPYKIAPGEQGSLNNEMNRDGAQAKGFIRSLGAKAVGATSVGTIVAFVLLMLGIMLFMVVAEGMLPPPEQNESQDSHLGRLPHPLVGMWPFLLLQFIITLAPFVAGRFAGVPVYKSAKEMANAGVIPITPQERAQYEAEFYKTNLFVKRIRSKRLQKMIPAFAVCAAPMVVLFVVAWLVIMAVHMPAEFTFVCLFLFLPTSLPIIIGLLPAIPMRRKIKDDGIAA